MTSEDKRYSFLNRDPYPEEPTSPRPPSPDRPRKDSVASTVITIRFQEPTKEPQDEKNIQPKPSQATLTEQPVGPPPPIPMARVRLLMVICSLSLAGFLAMLDQSILGSALPAITNQFGQLTLIAWVTAAYMLTFAALQSIMSKVSEIIGRLPVLLVSMAIFSCGSAICGAAVDMNMLIAGRAVAGIGGCGITTMAQVVLIDLLPLRERSTYISFMSFASTLAVVAGPLLGGAITDHWIWRWCFYINIPICVVIAVISYFTVKVRPPSGTTKEKLARIDFLGALLLIAGLVLIILALNWGGKTYPWRSAAVIAPLVLGALLMVAFMVVETKVAKEPIITMRMFTSRTLTPLLFSQFFLGAGITFTVLYLPVYYTVVFDASSTRAGILMLPYLVGMMVSGLVMGPIVSRFNIYRPFIWSGLAVMTVTAGLLNIITPQTQLPVVLVITGLFGLGSGVGMMPLMVATQATCEPQDAGTAATLALLLRNLGSIVGIATVGSIFNNRLVDSILAVASHYPQYQHQIAQSINDATVAWSPSLPLHIHQQIIDGYVDALKATFIANSPFVGIAFILSLFIKHRSLGKRQGPPPNEKKEDVENV